MTKKSNDSSISTSFYALGCTNVISIASDSTEEARHLSSLVISEVTRIERKFSRYISSSELSLLNSSAAKTEYKVDPEMGKLLDFADSGWHASNGALDITTGVLRRAWDFRNGINPGKQELHDLLLLVGWDKVDWNGTSIKFHLPGMEIDLGGIGKEYAVDRAVEILLAGGCKHACINFGGDVRVIGHKKDGSEWKVGIQNPRELTKTIGVLSVADAAIATSGDYQRYFESAGQRYCHILNPKTGLPVQDLQSVSVIANSCIVAGTLATAVMVLGEAEGLKLLSQNGFRYLIVDRLGRVKSNLG